MTTTKTGASHAEQRAPSVNTRRPLKEKPAFALHTCDDRCDVNCAVRCEQDRAEAFAAGRERLEREQAFKRFSAAGGSPVEFQEMYPELRRERLRRALLPPA